MKTLASCLLTLFLLLATPASAGEAVLKIAVPGTGIVRVQKVETTFVMSDQFGGLFNDSLILPEGEYRIQLFPTNGQKENLIYFDIEITDQATPVIVNRTIRPSSIVYGKRRMAAYRFDPRITPDGNLYRLDFTGEALVGGKEITILPFTDTTAWSAKPPARSNRQKIKVVTDPPGAEIWLNGERLEFSSNQEFFIPSGDTVRARNSLLLRKPGYANQIIGIHNGEDDTLIDVLLKAAQP